MKYLLILLLIPMACASKPRNNQILANSQDSLTVQNLTYVVWSLPFKHKDIVIAQAILETGWFKSKNCVNNNNLFGMRQVYTRTTTSDTVINGYSHYPNWKQSVIDYFILQSTRENIIPTSRTQYFHYLDKVYSEVGRNYSDQLKDLIKRLDLPNDEPNPVEKIHHKKKVKNLVKRKKITKFK